MQPTATPTASLSEPHIDRLLDEHRQRTLPRLTRLWDYYRNPARLDQSLTPPRHRLAQEQGLPARLLPEYQPPRIDQRPAEVVIENDIAWRLHTLVDFMFGKPFVLQSQAGDPRRARLIETFLHHVFEASGGICFFQDLALLGAVFGHIDIRVAPPRPISSRMSGSSSLHPATRSRAAGAAIADPLPRGDAGADRARGAISTRHLIEAARQIRLDIIEPRRGIAQLDPHDYRQLHAYLIHTRHEQEAPSQPASLLSRLRRTAAARLAGDIATIERTEVWTRESVRTYRTIDDTRTLVGELPNRLGVIPIVHIQNLSQPFAWEGLSEVEPLIPLQDELNTRLSDRANRVTFQSFKMYLGRGIEGFMDKCIGPGQMWATENRDADILEFGGDAACPSEEAHIAEIREALDKTSGVTPVAAGLLRNKVGNLTSENALRIVLMGLISKTEKKRVTYGAGIARLCELILHAADFADLLPNTPDERAIRLDWPSALPENEAQRLEEARIKLDLGVPRNQVLAELGYRPDPQPEALSA